MFANTHLTPCLEYPFAKYNVQSADYTYSQDEYTQFLDGAQFVPFRCEYLPSAYILKDKEWSKEETDYLFKTVREYDSRWHIINDRYEYPGGVQRTIEVCFPELTKGIFSNPFQDLKDRYYSVCRKLVRNRPWAGPEASKAQLLSTLEFDKGLLPFLSLPCET
jgi:DNA methyltransferase 1-associated protein 1